MKLARSTGLVAGLCLVLLGIWVAIIPFVGPYFNYGFGSHAVWDFHWNRLWLDILPGAAAIIGGLTLIGARDRISGWIGGWLAMVAGAWLLIGPSLALVWERHAGPIGLPLGGIDRVAVEYLGFFYASGALILALSAFALGRFLSRPRDVEEPAHGAYVADGAPQSGRFTRRHGATTTTTGAAAESSPLTRTPS